MTTIPRRTALKMAAAAVGLLALISNPATVLANQGTSLKFEIYKDTRGGFRWRLKAGNGRVIGTSGEGYKAKADCRSAIETIKRGASIASIEEVQ